ncbi:MAG: nucleoside monophosphate kinase [Candidatus Poribacteria bacterium]|nr:nucleoside monophosphate kinase [Candidatus Poribacteria bacterium]
MTTDKSLLHEADGLCYQAVMLVGPPGVGKGTQGKLLAQIPGIFHVSSGDMFRELDVNSKCGQIFQQYAGIGQLVPDDITIKIWQDYMEAKVREGVYTPERDLLILDGIPRNITQAGLIKPYINIFKVIFMVCEDREVMFKRIRGRSLKENRIDDSEEIVVRYRWDLYKRETEPLIDHYPQEIVRIIDADNIAADVLHQILSEIVPIQKDYFKPPLM